MLLVLSVRVCVCMNIRLLLLNCQVFLTRFGTQYLCIEVQLFSPKWLPIWPPLPKAYPMTNEMVVFLHQILYTLSLLQKNNMHNFFFQNGPQHGRQNEMLVFLHQHLYTLPLIQKNNICNFFSQNGPQHGHHRQTPLITNCCMACLSD